MCTMTEEPDPAGDGNKSDEESESYNLLEPWVDDSTWSSRPFFSRCFDDEGAPRRRRIESLRCSSLRGYSVNL